MSGITDAKLLHSRLDLERLKAAATILKVISHPTRLEIIHLLHKHESLTVSEMLSIIDIDQSALSHHLIKMRRCGVVIADKRGRNIYYSLEIKGIIKILDCMESCGFALNR
jgi:ArsR family transcriptional regulator, zinc-responsive transcriptional repressor